MTTSFPAAMPADFVASPDASADQAFAYRKVICCLLPFLMLYAPVAYLVKRNRHSIHFPSKEQVK